jgi:hypothetical protein
VKEPVRSKAVVVPAVVYSAITDQIAKGDGNRHCIFVSTVFKGVYVHLNMKAYLRRLWA